MIINKKNFIILPKYPQGGFSLTEIIVALFLVGVMVLVIANIPQAINLVTGSQSESLVRQVVAKKIQDLRLAGYDSLANGTTQISDSRLNGLASVAAATVITDCPVDVCVNEELAKKVTITVSWNESSEPKTYQIVTLISKGGLR